MTEEQKQSNRTKSKIKIGLMNLVYNMKRLMQLIKRDANIAKPNLMNPYREGAPEMAQ